MGKYLPRRNTAFIIVQQIIGSFALTKLRAKKHPFFFRELHNFIIYTRLRKQLKFINQLKTANMHSDRKNYIHYVKKYN